MPYRTRVSIRNPGPRTVRTVIYGGTIFEVLDPYSEVQSLTAIEDTEVILGPGESQVVEIDTWCLNQDYSEPSNTSMRLTALATSQTYRSQRDLWEDIMPRR